jgi:hypothetical protein
MEYPDNPEVLALKALCEREGGEKGHITIAKELGVSDQSIYQIITGVRLPSGRPKGIGPTLKDKLNRRYPGWNDKAQTAATELYGGSERLKAIMTTVLFSFRNIPEDRWESALMDASIALAKHHRIR